MPSPAVSPLLFGSFPQKPSRRRLRALAGRLQRDVAGSRPFCCYLTDDEELRRLNREFLGKDYPTDVLSFPSLDPEAELGELAISMERAEEQAAHFGHTLEEEVGILMLHGLLHLMGMDHQADAGQMALAEGEWRARLRLPAGLIERVGA